MTRRQQAFTIIELLVVISIIVLLIAILLPSLASARDQARYARWAAYSHGLQIDPEMTAYWDFQGKNGDDKLINRAAGDPMEQSRKFLKPADFDAEIRRGLVKYGQRWIPGRWKAKGALDFDNPGFADRVVASGFPTAIRNHFSVMVWANPASAYTQWQNLFSTRGGGNVFDMHFRASGKNLHADTGNGVVWYHTNMASTSTWTEGKWYQFVVTVSTANAKVYCNGKLENTYAYPAGATPLLFDIEVDPISLGAISPTGTELFDGVMDEVGVFRSEVGADTITEMFNVGATRQRG